MIANLKIRLMERHAAYMEEREKKLRKRRPILKLDLDPPKDLTELTPKDLLMLNTFRPKEIKTTSGNTI